MATYLDTARISSELMQLLREARERVVLVSFSLQVNVQIQERLKTLSQSGKVSEISIIYGRPELKGREMAWMAEVGALTLYQKENLHAKCYLNENKAIITSMNLYGYSQVNNVEMGMLITRMEDPDAFQNLWADIEHLKLHAVPQQIVQIRNGVYRLDEVQGTQDEASDLPLTYLQQIRQHLLEVFRSRQQRSAYSDIHQILTDAIIRKIAVCESLSWQDLHQIFPAQQQVDRFGADIFRELIWAEEYTIGRILDIRQVGGEIMHDQVLLETVETEELQWYHTKMDLPIPNQLVAVRLNADWFNEYWVLEENQA